MMDDKAYILIAAIALIGYGIWLFRVSLISVLLRLFNRIIKVLLAMRTKHQMETLRDAIHKADRDKEKTGRKNMVIYNTTTKQFDTIQKKQLKQVSKLQKRKKGVRTIDPERIRQIEKKSLYVTR